MLLWLLVAGAVVAAAGSSSGPRVFGARPTRKRRTIAATAEEEGESGIKTWGTHKDDMSAFWNPRYVKTLGTGEFRWGVCMVKWRQDMAKHPDVPKGAKAADWIGDAIITVIGYFYPVAKTIVNNACARFMFPLGRYEDDRGARAWAINTMAPPPGLDAAVPPFPASMPPRAGWKRAWVSFQRPNGSRTPSVASVFWPSSEEGGPLIRELASTTTLRALLRMDVKDDLGPIGALDGRQLAAEANGKSRWWLATAKKANAEYR